MRVDGDEGQHAQLGASWTGVGVHKRTDQSVRVRVQLRVKVRVKYDVTRSAHRQ